MTGNACVCAVPSESTRARAAVSRLPCRSRSSYPRYAERRQNQDRGDRRGGHKGPVPFRPPPQPRPGRLIPCEHGLIRHPPFDVVGERAAAGVTIFSRAGHCFETNGLQSPINRRIDRSRRAECHPSVPYEAFLQRHCLEAVPFRSARNTELRRGCKHRCEVQEYANRPWPARDSYNRACPARSRAKSRRCSLAEQGMKVPSPDETPGSILPTALASPQSTTSVSPCLPRITLLGLISRWRTPRECAYSMALQRSVKRRSILLNSSDLRPGLFFSDASA